jgi:L-alanine-DL-glutamate epimerase-like enolase superfamily enzyme
LPWRSCSAASTAARAACSPAGRRASISSSANGSSPRSRPSSQASADEALDALPQLAELGVAYCEQPLEAGDPAGPSVKERSPIPIYVDEDCHTLRDVAACAERAHGINVKLAKSGGIREAVRMVHAARALDLGCMLGCMIESGLGIAAGAHIASLFEHVDLDGNILLREDPWPGVELVDGVQLPAELPGLGVSWAT